MTTRGPKKAEKAKSPRTKAPTKGADTKRPRHGRSVVKGSAPHDFGSRTHELDRPLLGFSERARLRGINRSVIRERYEAAMRTLQSPAAPSTSSKKKDPRLVRLRAAHAELLGRPQPSIRSDYFESYEHKTAADSFREIMSGNMAPFKPGPSPSHALFKRKSGKSPSGSEGIPREDLEPTTISYDFLAGYRQSLANAVAGGDITRSLTVGRGNNTFKLSYGEIVAIAGDFFDTPTQIESEINKDVVDAIHAVNIDAQSVHALVLSRGGGLAGLMEFERLGIANIPHFTPYNWQAYCRYHGEAIDLALGGQLESALVRNAFADHFLTDAFSTGHVRTPRAVLHGGYLIADKDFQSLEMHNEDSQFGLWVQDRQGYVWRAYGDDHLGVNQVHILMTAFAVGRSIERIYRAYQADDATKGKLRAAREQGQGSLTPLDIAEAPDSIALPEILGDCGIPGFPAVGVLFPVAVGARPEPGGKDLIVNYMPLFGVDGDRAVRRKTSLSEAEAEVYFRFGAV